VRIVQGSVILADLDPSRGSEPGKVRPVVVAQTDLLREESDVMVDQLRAIDNRRLVRPLGQLSPASRRRLRSRLFAVLT
jgi:mRNA interferase MazF